MKFAIWNWGVSAPPENKCYCAHFLVSPLSCKRACMAAGKSHLQPEVSIGNDSEDLQKKINTDDGDNTLARNSSPGRY